MHDLVTRVMKKLAKPENIHVLENNSVDYILSSYFKGVDLEQPDPEVRDYEEK